MSIVGGLSILVISVFFLLKSRRSELLSVYGDGNIKTLAAQVKNPVKILFIGDMMFDRYIRQALEKRHNPCFPFAKMSQFLNEFDAVIGNNEGPITANNSVSIKTAATPVEQLTFTFDQAIADCYQKNNIKIVGIGNNHIMNFGADGVVQTTQALNAAGVAYFGNPLNEKENYTVQNIGGRTVAIVAYNYAYGLSAEEVAKQIRELRSKVEALIVFAHWGKEYDINSDEKQHNLAHLFVEAGADTVIGMHPHVIQDDELYQGKHIYYSLGNFIFDQYFSPETKKGMGITLTINPDNSLDFAKNFFENTSSGQVQLITNN